MSRIRTLVVCPGRGSYDRAALGQLQDRGPEARAVIEACDAWRAEHGRPTVSELDADERFRTTRHVAGEHASLLTFACSLADLADLDRDRHQVVGVTGNSMGWYTALAAARALPLHDAIRLVDTMGAYQAGNVLGGQVLYPITDPEWAPDPDLRRSVEHALQSARGLGHVADWSIDLGGFAVLGGDGAAVKSLLQTLPPVERGSRTFPLQLPLHSAFHTAVMQPTSLRARRELSDLDLSAPSVPLIDGRGLVHRPHWTSAADLLDYTLGHQVVATYDFATAVRVGLRHCAPDLVVALGPGNSLGGPLARILAAEGWRGARGKSGFARLGDADPPLLLSFGLPPQRRQLT